MAKLPTWREFRKEVKTYDGPPFVVNAQIDRLSFANALVDSGCLSYAIISEQFAKKHNLERISIPARPMEGYDGNEQQILEVARFALDIGGNYQPCIYAYVVTRMAEHDMILGLPWMTHQKVTLHADGPRLEFSNGIGIGPDDSRKEPLDLVPISAEAFALWNRQRRKNKRIEVFAVSLRDIDKALQHKKHTDPKTKLPTAYHDFLEVFDRERADYLPPLRGPSIDHKIELIERDENGRKPEPPWGPLYNMSREELLVLRKTLTDYLGKGFIRVSSSPAAAPVLFVRKPGGGLRFCCDYRALNRLTKKDRYPLPLIHETLERIGKAKWFTKLDVIAAFHKIRIAEGDEWLTAFRTRFGLYEWLVTPFGLANAPSTFQRYINWTLRDYLDDFASAYLDDVLIFSSGTLAEHRTHVGKVLERLRDAGLQLDIDKCEFEVKSTKYLGFIIEAGVGIRMDPEKVKAILDWETPRTVKGVRSFLGFANFYRRFIKGFSEVTAPLSELTHKDRKFEWNNTADRAFRQLKELFTTAPILVQFDPERETIVEADSSGWAIGGVLSQYDSDGLLRPVAYFSRKNTPAECNYEIHDKELLAIICCLKEWESELTSVERFTIITDHKNLRYFTALRRLTERQMRWAGVLSRYDFTLQYRPGRLAIRPDALSRREQDMPDDNDERITSRERRLFSPEMLKTNAICVAPMRVSPNEETSIVEALEDDSIQSLEDQWTMAEREDPLMERLKDAVRRKLPRFPKDLDIKVSLAECELDTNDRLLFRGRRWVPKSEPLRTRLLQEAHDSLLTGHPGHNMLYALLSRRVYWPGMSEDARRFTRNCDSCGANTVWRNRRHGLLKPLPIPERKWREISIDFIEKLPESSGCTNAMVIVDRLSKGVIVEPCEKIDAETVARKLIKVFIGYHGIPDAITSDRGTQFVNDMWECFCRLLKIRRRLSTAYHPQTDGQTERMNAVVEEYFRNFCTWAQDNWAFLAPIAQLAINGRDAASTGVSPFFLDHGYNVETLDLHEPVTEDPQPRDGRTKAENIIAKMKTALDIAQAEIAAAQQRQEDYANRRRQEAVEYCVGDKVWLDLRNIRTDRPSKKLDHRNAKFTIVEKIGSHAYRLNVPNGIHDVFHVSLLRPAAKDPFPSQQLTDYQPPGVLVDGELEYAIDCITGERMRRIGRGWRKEYRVKWTGYAEEQWEPANNLEDTIALDEWLNRHQHEEGGNVIG